MKNIFFSLFICILTYSHYGCVEIDNYKEPNETFTGNIIDKTTGKNLITETQNFSLRLYELSWSDTPSPQSIPVKHDGSFMDAKLFAGHYQVYPYDGPFWPVEPIEIDIKGTTVKDFEVTPYLKIEDFKWSVSGTTLKMSFNISAPIKDGLPNIKDVKPFVFTTKFVGEGAKIDQYSDGYRQDINQKWSDELGTKNFEFEITQLFSGRTYYARVGARVDDSYKKYNYSEVVEIKIP